MRAGALGARRDAFAEDEDLAGHRARRRRPGVYAYAVEAVDPEYQAVVLGLRPGIPARARASLSHDTGFRPVVIRRALVSRDPLSQRSSTISLSLSGGD